MFVAGTHDKPYLRLMQLILFNAAPFFMVPKEASVENVKERCPKRIKEVKHG